MAKKLSIFIEKWWFVISAIILVGILIYGYFKMYFHQDDLDWFIMANRPFWQVMAAPIADHVDYIYRILLKIEWNIFGLYFPGYLLVSVFIHGVIVYLIYYLAWLSSRRLDLSAIVALLFAINTNWTEVVLWISGQTISITLLFVLLAMISIWKKKYEVSTIFMACMTSALALGLPIAAMLVFGYSFSKKKINSFKLSRVGWGVIFALGVVAVVYYYLATDGTKIEFGLRWALQAVQVWGLAIVNTVIGRTLIPFDRLEKIRLFVVTLLSIWILVKWRDRLGEIWRDSWSRFLVLQIAFYYLIVAAGRSQYGVGMMRAERYAYLGIALVLLLLVRILRKVQLGNWIIAVPILVVIQCFGLYQRANFYVQRPQQLKSLIQDVRKDRTKHNADDYLPEFVFGYEKLRYGDLMGLLKD